MTRDDPPPPVPGVASLFAELCDLPGPERERLLAELGRDFPKLAAQAAHLLALDERAEGPLERLRGEVAAAAEQRLLAGDLPAATAGARIGPWRLIERLGVGGMGEVWLGEREGGGFAQSAAVKLVRPGMASELVESRFALERQVLARLEHPAIARLLDGGVSADGRPWFAMERVIGVPITEHARTLPLEARLRLFLRVCEAVDFAHRNLVLHRDLKPSNVMVDAGGTPKLLDFGLAKLLEAEADPGLTVTELRVLTPAYAAPEQVLGEPATTATDVYALGVLLCEMLTGRRPHRRDATTGARLAEQVAHETVERPSALLRRRRDEAESSNPASDLPPDEAGRLARRLEGDLDTIVLKALRREPERRYHSAAALADDLRRHLEGRPVAARPDTRVYRLGKFLRRHRVAALAAAAVALSLVAGLSIALVQAGRARQAADRAAAEAQRARREGERATHMKDFLLSVFQEASPLQRARGAPLSIEELLDAAEARIDGELAAEPLLQADLWDDLAETRAAAGNLERAAALIEKALAAKRTHLGAEDLSLVESLVNRGAIANLAGDGEGAVAALDEAARILATRGEEDSPRGTDLAINRVHALLLLQRNEEAAAAAERAYALTLRWRPGSPDAAMQRVNAGIIAQRRGLYLAARDHFERALVELEAVVGPDHALARTPLTWLAGLYENHLSDPVRAVEYWERGLAIARRAYPDGSPVIAKMEGDLARVRGKRADRSPEPVRP